MIKLANMSKCVDNISGVLGDGTSLHAVSEWIQGPRLLGRW